MTDTDDQPRDGRREPIACSLSSERTSDQLVEWRDLRRLARGAAPIESGVRMTFPVGLLDDVQDLAAREQTCCSFLTLTAQAVGDDCVLEVVSDHPDAAPVISALSGVPLT